MVESTVILRARICAAELATLAAGVWAFANVGPNAGTQSAPTAKIEIKQQRRFLIANMVNWRVQQYAEASAIILKQYSFGEIKRLCGCDEKRILVSASHVEGSCHSKLDVMI